MAFGALVRGLIMEGRWRGRGRTASPAHPVPARECRKESTEPMNNPNKPSTPAPQKAAPKPATPPAPAKAPPAPAAKPPIANPQKAPPKR